MKQVGKYFKEWIPEKEWEGKYLIKRKEIGSIESISFFLIFSIMGLIIAHNYINVINDAIPFLDRYYTNYTSTAKFDYLCDSYLNYNCENHFVNITGVFCDGKTICQNTLKEGIK